MRDSTVSASKSRSPPACMRTTSRSVKMPTGHSPESGPSTAPTFSACMVRIASVMLDLADTVTTRRPLPTNTSLSFIGASCNCYGILPAQLGWHRTGHRPKSNDFSVQRLEARQHAAREALHIGAREVGGQRAELAHDEQVAKAHLAPVPLESFGDGLGAAADEETQLDRLL